MGLHFPDRIEYSDTYEDENYQYRHVTLPESLFRHQLPRNTLLTEDQWRALGIKYGERWEHFLLFPQEPHVLLFRREIIKKTTRAFHQENEHNTIIGNEEGDGYFSQRFQNYQI